MNSYNDFQYYTSIYNLYNYFINNKDTVKEILKKGFIENYSQTNFRRFIQKAIGTGVYVGSVVSLIYGIQTENLYPFYAMTLGALPTYEILRNRLNDKYESKLESKAGELYYEYLAIISQHITESEELDLSDDDIHNISLNLINGEKERKYSSIAEDGKCPLVIFEGYTEFQYLSWIMPINDPIMSRIYEVTMHIFTSMYEGYEDDIRHLYKSLLNCNKRLLMKADITQYEEIFNYYEQKCSKKARERCIN